MSLFFDPPPPLVFLPLQRDYEAGDNINGYTIVEFLGKGSFGSVYLVEDKEKNVFALKKLTLAADGELPTTLLREVSLLASTKHANIIGLEKVMVKGDCLWLLMELGCNTLEDRLKKDYTHEHIAKWTTQLIDALSYMHLNQIVHRDLNPSNILVDAADNVKVSDFGFAKHLYVGEAMTPEVGNAEYSAPELLLGSTSYGKEVDMWSLGCVVAEMTMRSPAFDLGGSMMQSMFDCAPKPSKRSSKFYSRSILNAIFRDLGVPSEEDWPGVTKLYWYPPSEDLVDFPSKLKIYEILDTVDENLKDLIQKLLFVVPERRLSVAAAKSHPFLSVKHA